MMDADKTETAAQVSVQFLPKEKSPDEPLPPDGGWGWVVIVGAFFILVSSCHNFVFCNCFVLVCFVNVLC